jgi:Uma2 family endonuclease
VLTEDDRVELIGGELVPMAAKGNRHENLKTALVDSMYRRLPVDLRLSVELGWRAGSDMYLEPDIAIFAAVADVTRVAPADMLLVLEVAASSLAFDTGRKAQVYATLGVRDYWVVNATDYTTRVYRDPSATGYGTITNHAAADGVVPLLLPSLAVKLADFGLS